MQELKLTLGAATLHACRTNPHSFPHITDIMALQQQQHQTVVVGVS